MNLYGEDKWPLEQRDLDLRITRDFEGIEGSCVRDDETGKPTKAWLKEQRAAADALGVLVDGLDSTARRAHWRSELARLGLPVEEAAPVVAPDATPTPAAAVAGGKRG